MTNAPSYARAAVANAAKQVPKTAPTRTTFTGNKLSNGLSNISDVLNNSLNTVYNASAAGAAMANNASAAAQAAQFGYNKELMDLQNTQQEKLLQAQMDFSTQSAERANAFQQAMWEKTAEYNAAQAQIQRDWDEKMANTAYQRTMADMKAAGLNPILAYQQGASSFGSGASATMSSGGASQAATPGASAASGSVGNYGGQGFQVSDTLAIIGSVVGLISELANSAKITEALNKYESSVTGRYNSYNSAQEDLSKVHSGKMTEQEYQEKHGNALPVGITKLKWLLSGRI